MNTTFKDFHDTLLDNLENYIGEYESFINNGPILFKLLCDLLNTDIDDSLRLPICGAIAYYVTPEDVIPESKYGPYGYIDDIYISTYVLKLVAKKHGYDFIQKHAENNDIEKMIKESELKTLEILNEKEIQSILKYIGL
ncbi:MAG: DUF1232 domain-containing protein [Methanobrevibacter thaueri]|nr:DUF1232 domain-containing protein [Methanobrevibacter thaueri]